MRIRNVCLCMTLVASLAASVYAQERPTAPSTNLAKDLAEGRARLAPVGPPKGAPTTYGTVPVSYYRIGSTELSPYESTITYADTNTFTAFQRHPTAGFNFIAVPHLPSGALLTYLEIDYCDTSVASDVLAALFGCDFNGNNCTSVSGTLQSNTSGGCGNVNTDLTAAGFTVDNFLNELVLVVEPFATDGTTSVAGAIIGYVLQVSTPPVTATFFDVPDTDGAYAFIEAFVAAGITVGCDTGPPARYCPDDFVTRRQMAVFFAKALGLQFQ